MKKVLMYSPCRGAGVTFIVANTGVALARSGLPVLLGEATGQSIGKHFFNWSPPVVSERQRYFHGIQKQQIENQLYVTDGVSQEHRKTSDFRQFAELFDTATSQTSEILLLESTDKFLPVQSVLSRINWLVIVITPEESSFVELARCLDELSNIKKLAPDLRTLVVLNQYNPASQLSRDVFRLLQTSLPLVIFPEPMLLDVSVEEALAGGLPLIEHAPYSPLVHTMHTFAQYLITREGNTHVAA